MVTSDMSLSLVRYLDISTQYLPKVSTISITVSVLLNLMVINALREKESLLARSHNLVLGNICCANLVRGCTEMTLIENTHWGIP